MVSATGSAIPFQWIKAGVPNREMRLAGPHRLFVCVLILAVLSTFISGCSGETKHKVLNFFFTGVPPLGQEKEDELEKDASAQAPEQAPTIVKVYTHPITAANLCNECHQTLANFALFGRSTGAASFQKGAMSPGPLVVDRNELCIKCHKDKSASEALTAGLWMHPTSAKGDCYACHDPHQSTHQYMLLDEPAKICTPCHKEDEMLAKVKDKEAHKLPSDCLSCHNPHLGKNRALLTKDYKEVKYPVVSIPGLPSSQALPRELPIGSSVSD